MSLQTTGSDPMNSCLIMTRADITMVTTTIHLFKTNSQNSSLGITCYITIIISSSQTDLSATEAHCSAADWYYLLADVGYGVHPAANANLIAYIWRIAKLMHYSNVIGVGPPEEQTLQCDWVDLWRGINECITSALKFGKIELEKRKCIRPDQCQIWFHWKTFSTFKSFILLNSINVNYSERESHLNGLNIIKKLIFATLITGGEVYGTQLFV